MIWPTLPKTVEYALKVLICLTICPGRLVSAGAVAGYMRIPPSQAAKTLRFLGWVGLVRSRRGSGGGYQLARNPEEIRVEQVLKLLRPALDAEAAEGLGDPIVRIWSETAERSEKDWEQFTVAELARRTASQWECAGCTQGVASEARQFLGGNHP